MAPDWGDGIIVLSPKGKLAGGKVGGDNSAKTETAVAVRQALNRGRVAENEAENQPADRDCPQRRLGDARRFAARDRSAGSSPVIAPDKAGCEPDPSHAASGGATGPAFPAQRAAAVFPPPPGVKAPPELPPASATPAKPSTCDAVIRQPARGKMSGHNHHAAHDWNKTPADL